MCSCLNDTMSLSPTKKPVHEDNSHSSSSSSSLSLSSLPNDAILRCLLGVPRSSHLNVSHVNKTFRSLVRSPEFKFHQIRSLLLRKDSVYVCFSYGDSGVFQWFTLRPFEIENEKKKTIEYRLVPFSIPRPSNGFAFVPSDVLAVGSEIYFIGYNSKEDSDSYKDLWIFDTRSGNLTQGPSMKFHRRAYAAVEVVEGKIYVIGGEYKGAEEMRVEVFDPKTRIWSFAWEEKLPWLRSQFCATLEGKVVTVHDRGYVIAVYDPRQGKREEMNVGKEMVETRRSVPDMLICVCAVENVLYGCFISSGFMWFDIKRSVWTRLVMSESDYIFDVTDYFDVDAMVEYHGKLAVFWHHHKFSQEEKNYDSKCGLMALDKVGGKIRGTIEWSGVVATNVPNYCKIEHCFAVSH
ncbi:unnamed protein product [Microthlaspi erraticum]|uniref:F-box domain-containing protein n=1 Tax=Microthlaspi erraticum TaxID=1685480 RepID=A0A6D2HYV5_9BRAS|nr:unnamed protein product [Microthlaspi erraticum]